MHIITTTIRWTTTPIANAILIGITPERYGITFANRITQIVTKQITCITQILGFFLGREPTNSSDHIT